VVAAVGIVDATGAMSMESGSPARKIVLKTL
jgi:hypothetical protein